ncbi:MAG: tetratricopeptide repeat protein [Elusimicrobia bacterium]|nr:tetratricopeptide repeat protein [Elusimicrobiota bacterium]
MNESRRTNVLIAASLLMIAAAFAAYAALLMHWFAEPGPAAPVSAEERARRDADDAALADARTDFRGDLLDCRAHLRLSEALWKDGRRIDAFYVSSFARELFSDAEFHRAHDDVVLGAGGPAAAVLAKLQGLDDPSRIAPILAEAARDYPDAPEGREALAHLARLAGGGDGAAGDDAALNALQDLRAGAPKNPEVLAALGRAYFARGQADQALAMAQVALSKDPNDAGAARIMADAALKKKDFANALRWLTQAWDGDPNDVDSASELAQLYDKRRGDVEAALPYYLAVYRADPDASDGDESVETRIREALDARRQDLLSGVTAADLGSRFSLDDASLRAQAALRAADLKDPRWIPELARLLDDDTHLVRRSADYALYEIAQADPADVRAHRDEWLNSPSPLVRIRALNLFADLDGMNALPAVRRALLKDPNPGVRAFAKVMVLDHYYLKTPDGRRAAADFASREKDRRVLDFVRRLEAQEK